MVTLLVPWRAGAPSDPDDGAAWGGAAQAARTRHRASARCARLGYEILNTTAYPALTPEIPGP